MSQNSTSAKTLELNQLTNTIQSLHEQIENKDKEIAELKELVAQPLCHSADKPSAAVGQHPQLYKVPAAIGQHHEYISHLLL